MIKNGKKRSFEKQKYEAGRQDGLEAGRKIGLEDGRKLGLEAVEQMA